MASAKAAEVERTRLSRSAVVDRTLQLADAEGIDALTIRRLATELGVTPMALYWHFRNKEELIAGLADRIWSEIRGDVDPTAAWPRQLRGLLESLIDVLRAHSSASQLLIDSEKLGPSHWEVTEVTLEVLHRAGFDAMHASEIARSVLWTGLMLVMSEAGFDPGITEEERAERLRRKQVELASLPPQRYPRLVEAAVPLTTCTDDAAFHYQFGVDLFIAGVQAMAPGGGSRGVVPPGQHGGGSRGVVPPGQHGGGSRGVAPPGQHGGVAPSVQLNGGVRGQLTPDRHGGS